MTRAWLVPSFLLLTACTTHQGIEGLQTFTYPGGDQRSGSLVYAENPPAGGPYNPLWQNCGVYSKPVYSEYAVHSLARGAVWLTYRPELDEAQLGTLKTLLKDHPRTILSPLDSMDSPVTITAWNAQLKVEKPDDPRLSAFLKRYETGETAPERGAACSGGYGGTR